MPLTPPTRGEHSHRSTPLPAVTAVDMLPTLERCTRTIHPHRPRPTKSPASAKRLPGCHRLAIRRPARTGHCLVASSHDRPEPQSAATAHGTEEAISSIAPAADESPDVLRTDPGRVATDSTRFRSSVLQLIVELLAPTERVGICDPSAGSAATPIRPAGTRTSAATPTRPAPTSRSTSSRPHPSSPNTRASVPHQKPR